MALSPKSNSAYLAIDEALAYVKENPTIEVPGPLSNVSPEKKHYRYPHNSPGHWVDQRYLPKDVETKFYHAELNGSEKALVDQFVQLTGKKP
jgi:putative ATPase